MKKTAVELFSGAGGLGLGLTQAGFEIVLANDNDKNCADSFKKNHKNTHFLRKDIRTIDFKKEIASLGRPIDLVSGGPPCQGFSTIGSKNKRDPRNGLFYQFIRAVGEINPKYVLFENVSGFCRLYKGIAHKTLLSKLHSLGYDTCSGLLDASDFGLPQKRTRFAALAWKRSLSPLSLPRSKKFLKRYSLMDAISDLPELRAGESINRYKYHPLNDYQKTMRGGKKILTEHNAGNHGEKMKKILGLIPKGGSIEDIPVCLRPKKFFKNTYARLFPHLPSPTITRNFGTPSSSRCVHPFQPRALSTREGARLQGFPDSYQFLGTKTAKNLQVGNAVPPILGKVLGEIML